MRTSLTHPLVIAEVQSKEGHGRIGTTFCPGKYQPDAMTGGWERDLDVDLDAIRDWGATAIVTLIEDHELAALRVADLGMKARERHITWYHTPIPDGSTPSADFESAWTEVGEGLRA